MSGSRSADSRSVLKQHETVSTTEPVRRWLSEDERRASLDAQRADIESGIHPERYVGWFSFTVACVENGTRALYLLSIFVAIGCSGQAFTSLQPTGDASNDSHEQWDSGAVHTSDAATIEVEVSNYDAGRLLQGDSGTSRGGDSGRPDASYRDSGSEVDSAPVVTLCKPLSCPVCFLSPGCCQADNTCGCPNSTFFCGAP